MLVRLDKARDEALPVWRRPLHSQVSIDKGSHLLITMSRPETAQGKVTDMATADIYEKSGIHVSFLT